MPKLFGTSGIRTTVDKLTEDFVTELGKSLGSYSKDKKIAIGRDTRKSGPQLEYYLINGILSTGKDIIKLGIATTPTVGMAAQDFGTAVMITASHNPPEYNGFKFWYKDGAYRPKQEDEIENIFFSRKFKSSDTKGKIDIDNYTEKHKERILKKVGNAENVNVLLDCAGGSGSVITPDLLKEMGCNVIALNTNQDGEFPHKLEPTAENLEEICKEVKSRNVDIGLVHDGDADRTAAIDKNGRLIDWDSFLAVLAYGKNKVVTTVDASMRIEEVCKKVIRVPVGDVAVSEGIRKEKADFGGEPSGAYIFPEVHLFPDGPLTAAIVAKLISENKFYEILEKIPSYPMERLKIPYSDGMKDSIMKKLKNIISENFTNIDGIRISRENCWVLIRPSGTEPFMRITAEGKDNKSLSSIVEDAKNLLKEAMG